MPKVQESITMLPLTEEVFSQLPVAPNDKLVLAGMYNCGFETADMA